MIVLYQINWCPFCIIQRRILEYGRIRFRVVQVPVEDRRVIWRLTKGRYYQVPVLKHDGHVLFEVAEDSQVLAKYLDTQFSLGLFQRPWEGIQDVLWRYFEDEPAQIASRLNAIYWQEFVPSAQQCAFVRHLEYRFGSGCLETWRADSARLLARLETLLRPAERMLGTHPFLLADTPLFVDFCLFGVLQALLYSDHYELPAGYGRLRDWHARMRTIRQPTSA
jgi:glutathione S-transferase